MYVAIVGKNYPRDAPTQRTAQFTAKTKDVVIQAALKLKADWEKSGQYGPYEIFVGKLTEKVQRVPVEYKLVKI